MQKKKTEKDKQKLRGNRDNEEAKQPQNKKIKI